MKDIRSFLDHAGFYQRFIKDFSKISKPLTNLLVKDVQFEFDRDCLEAFTKLKGVLTSAPIIQPPNWGEPFELMCNINDYAVRAVLGQMKNKKLYVIYYANKVLTEAQMNYATT